jgi:hypothetical protein
MGMMQQQTLWNMPEEQQPRMLTYGDIFELKFSPPDWMTPKGLQAYMRKRQWQSIVEILGYKKEYVHFDVRYLDTRIEGGMVIATCELFDACKELFGWKHADEEDSED